ncbi:hypothetical protein HMPREF0044_0227 [Gleimia coleocanis DSM 15436]|uniref:DUF1540 domain-containing protein n=1 Tax=Gleimia coleocanis DSM 15436 TaxID=525245 RepID=C0VYI7_9ACTO|nr:hypothetical protein [Gleimia coleocanis]EEH64490.1 hypothetical protein HMPREF0044_0227 [Gleimia coleocanis DSM 15436]
MTTPEINCATTSCSFNNNGCGAYAATIGTKGCVTFLEIGVRPTIKHEATVGACQRTDCTFNHDLACDATAVTVTNAECQTFTAK